MSDEDQSTEDFLKEIEEYQFYSKRTESLNSKEDTDEEDGNTSKYDDKRESELDNWKQYIEDLKEEIELEKLKVKSLNEVINNQNKVIETLRNKHECETTKRRSQIKCRYWNRGYCKEGDSCNFKHLEEDCESFLKNRKCEDMKCYKRHRTYCRYFRTEEGCYRKASCQYLHVEPHMKNKQIRREKNEETPEQSTNTTFYCDQCEFKCKREATLRKHVNTKHDEGRSSSETISNFIFRLALEDWAMEYKNYFFKKGVNFKEANYVESMVDTYGAEYTLDYIK